MKSVSLRSREDDDDEEDEENEPLSFDSFGTLDPSIGLAKASRGTSPMRDQSIATLSTRPWRAF